MIYRGYKIEPDSLLGHVFESESYDGPEDGRCGHGTLKDCLNQIDDYIADKLYCKTCESTGKCVDAEGFKFECEDCAKVRSTLKGINYPETCPNCNKAFVELWPGSGLEIMRCQCR